MTDRRSFVVHRSDRSPGSRKSPLEAAPANNNGGDEDAVRMQWRAGAEDSYVHIKDYYYTQRGTKRMGLPWSTTDFVYLRQSEEPVHSNMDISTGHLILSYMEEHLNNKEKLEQEWNNLCAYQPDNTKAEVGKREVNLSKNRYLDIIPYDNNRAILKTKEADGEDYINASFVINHDPKNPQYIVTQGPLSNTVAHFWQLVWEQGSIVIVNLTRLVEDGHTLCHKYWPEEGSELYNNYEVHLVSEHVWCEDYLVRSFYLKNVSNGETRTVTQFHFLTWPDLKEPNSVKALLDFRRKVNKSYKGRSCPIVIHCSDGCGRAGTYMLLDMLLTRLSKGVKEMDISAAVEHLRDQRCEMVKTRSQFEFVLMAIAEEVHAMLKTLPQ